MTPINQHGSQPKDPDGSEQGLELLDWSPASQEANQVAMGRALFKLQQWLIEMYKRDFANEDEEGVVRLNPEISARFALGMLPSETFIVMPDLEAEWASLMAWSHAAMQEGEPTVFLVTAPIIIDGEGAPDFGISFQIPDFAKAKALSQRAILQLRRYIQSSRGWTVDPLPFTEMPMVILDGDQRVFDRTNRKLKYKGQKGRGKV